MTSVLSEARFHNEEAAFAYVEARLWPEGPVCPFCGADGDKIGALKGATTRIGLSHGGIGRHFGLVNLDEIEDPVTTCIHPCNKVGPCHRTLRRDAGGERSKISLGLEFGEVRHFAFAHEAMQELGIHSVEAQNNKALMALRRRSGGAAGRQRHRCDE